MRCVAFLLVLLSCRSITAESLEKLLQTFEDVKEDGLVSESCQQAFGRYLESLQNLPNDTWALRMFDATSKLPVGLLSLNFGELGQYRQCLRTKSDDGLIKGKYCLGTLSLSGITEETGMVISREKVQRIRTTAAQIVTADGSAQDELAEALQFGITWAICLPSDCTDEDAGVILNLIIGSTTTNCQTEDTVRPPISDGAIAATVVLSFFAFLLMSSTALDLFYKYFDKKPPHVIFIAFSVYSNGAKLFHINRNSTELTCLNGIRLFSMLWVIIGHVYVMHMASPILNFMDVVEWFDVPRSMTITNATLSVDTFFFLSGLLLVYTFIKAKQRGVHFNILQFYIHRYLRLTPALAALVLFSAHLMRYIGTGPKWNSISILESMCQKYWWTSLLYVQNYVNGNDSGYCLTHTWYLNIDMQLYIISPLVLLPLWKYPKIGLSIVGAAIVTFLVVPFTIAYITEIPALMVNLQSHVSVDDYNKYYYMMTHARAAPWFIGLLFGYVLARMKFQGEFRIPKLNKVIVVLLWATCLAVMLTCIYGGHDALMSADYDRWGNVFHLTFVRPVWAVCLAWVVFACVNGYGGPVNWFLSFPIYQVLNRFTYSVYLIHYPLMLAFAFMSKSAVYFDDLNVAYSFWGLTMFSFMISVVWVLAFESPVVVLEKVLFNVSTKSSKEENGSKNGLSA